ncbi:ATP-dependent DNA helicase RecQ [Companilactobacillus crustorum]|uniref:DNA helicase RecQ n=3 Tax=Companilactobacillus TaxID=2767879 RepID=A0A837RKP0_9LACO|nr:DNA helicase RecQ [Companilactobacillus crustorum]APU71401.1 putative ATP-dependent DNA helicase RecQ [Companilactobacillus crustorum]KRK43810.1 ATP-dependent DNA helicase RecQ [Companilactobacillus crustorum JCM 15951]KRO21133.1 ATP-dependent DNA helicase RecQ [Companilactobacillus crustorum]WDT66570.1 DNA helicase RecQ [Companilactobacillus crustorum]GEO76716.1 ATP-dependent DNA helicase RecQ [Companilactobacillus crustorum]
MKLEATLKEEFGYDTFRPGQRELIEKVMAGQKAMGIMPTGGGKSICYQLPATILSGLTLVVSPLISLMKDQVDSLNEVGIPATFLNSTVEWHDREERMRYIESGAVKLLFVAPEKIVDDEFYSWLSALDISLIAIDEAHVLSSWGHDFRNSYLKMVEPLQQLPGKPAWLALTATATEQVQDDLAQILKIPADNIVKTGFDRDNIALKIERGVDKSEYVLNYVKAHIDESGIIYAGRREDVDNIYEFLRANDVLVGRYHAGLSDQERHQQQEDFLFDRINVIVATNAFGMGINKTNVRYVVHFTIPGTIESYYQEVGRAGRDGLPAEAVLLYAPADLRLHQFFIDHSQGDDQYKLSLKNKLFEMSRYAETEVCLMKFILDYFGEKNSEICGRCSNCLDNREVEDVTADAQKVLSCVVRMNQRYGKKLIARVLVGKDDVADDWRHFEKLSTFGIFKDRTLKETSRLIEFLFANGLLRSSGGEYPTLLLSKKGLAVLKGQLNVAKKKDEQQVPDRKPMVDDGSFDVDLFEKLRALRLSFARKQALPPFMIFSDKTLKDMCVRIPTNSREFLAVSGVGKVKLEQYGESFINEIKEYQKAE